MITLVIEGTKGGLSPHPLFDPAACLETCPDVAAAGLDPLLHYLSTGALEQRSPHPLFDPAYYVGQCDGGWVRSENEKFAGSNREAGAGLFERRGVGATASLFSST